MNHSHINAILIYQNNPFENGQGGGNAYVRNLFTELGKIKKINLFYWGANYHNKNNFTNLTNSNNFFIFWASVLIKIIRSKFDVPTVLHFHRLYFAATAILIIKVLRKKNVKVVSTVHGETFHNFRVNMPKFISYILLPILFYIEKRSFMLINNYAFVSNRNKEFFMTRHKSINKYIEKAGVFSSMVNFPIILHAEERNYFVMIGRLSEVKDHLFMFSAIAEYQEKLRKNNFSLKIFGDGELKSFLKNYINENQLEDLILLCGEIDNTMVPEVLKNAKGLLLTSKNEAAPTVIIEAIACGVPVLSCDVGFAREVLDNTSLGKVLPKNKKIFINEIMAINKIIFNQKEQENVLIDRHPTTVSKRYYKELYTKANYVI